MDGWLGWMDEIGEWMNGQMNETDGWVEWTDG